jgi:hypothetical protein
MKARLVKFGEIEVEGKRYTHDVVIEGGKVRKRKKGASTHFREEFGHVSRKRSESLMRSLTLLPKRRVSHAHRTAERVK